MPKRLGTDAFSRKTTNPYDALFASVADGDTWRLDRGSDFTCSDIHLRKLAGAYAERNGVTLRFERVRRGDRVVAVEVAFTHSSGQENEAEGAAQLRTA